MGLQLGFLNDLSEQTYTWAEGVTPVNFTNWKPGQGVTPVNESMCGVIWSGGLWVARLCDQSSSGFICQKQPGGEMCR